MDTKEIDEMLEEAQKKKEEIDRDVAVLIKLKKKIEKKVD